MSDALLERLATAAEGILAHLKKSPSVPTAGAATPPKTGPATGGAASGGKPAEKTAAEKKAAEKAAADKASAASTTTKAPVKGGKHTDAQVREMIRKVAADKNLGKQAAKNILADDGGGVERVLDLKPEFYDAVFEACEVLLKGEGEKPGAAPEEEDDLM
jgi:hypothetical protein